MKNTIVEILLVEDNPDDAEMTIRALKKHNIANNLARLPNGAEAIDFIFGTGTFAGRDTDISQWDLLSNTACIITGQQIVHCSDKQLIMNKFVIRHLF